MMKSYPLEYLQVIQRFRLLDDTFMTAVFDGDIEATQLVLRIILDKPDLIVVTSQAQHLLKNLQGVGPVTDLVLQFCRQLPEGLVVTVRNEEGVIAEAAAAVLFQQNMTFHCTAGGDMSAVWEHHGDDGDESAGPLFIGEGAQQPDQFLVVFFIVGILAGGVIFSQVIAHGGVTRRVDPRRPAQGIRLDA